MGVMQVILFRDDKNYPRVKTPKSFKLLGSFLESEIQNDRKYGEEIIRVIDEIKNGQISEWEETGNAHTLILMPEKAKIENEFTNEMCELYLDDLRQSILDWLAFIGE